MLRLIELWVEIGLLMAAETFELSMFWALEKLLFHRSNVSLLFFVCRLFFKFVRLWSDN